jgi:hypothetical protein
MVRAIDAFIHPAALLAHVGKHEVTVHFAWSLQPMVALIAGLLILIRPQLLNYVVAAYLIFVGLIGVFGLNW